MNSNQGEFLLTSPQHAQSESTRSPSVHNIFLGIAGWSYPDWEGFVYTSKVRDKLRFIAGYVDMIEINNTFYRPPEAKTVQAWADKTRDIPHFFFTAKLHREITHEGIIGERMTMDFHKGFEPMIGNGKLHHLLAQFKHDFDNTPEHRIHLGNINKTFGDITNLTLELRHSSWQNNDALDFLRSLNVTVANLDYPTTAESFNLDNTGIGQNAYLRLHGRNSKAWFDKKAGRDETYNYAYSAEELSVIKKRTEIIAKTAKTLTIVANNHYQGKEVANILQLKAMLSGKKVAMPPRLLDKYPQLHAFSINS